MKRLLSCAICAVALCASFSVGYYLSYRHAYNERYAGINHELQDDTVAEQDNTQQPPVETADVVVGSNTVVKPSTRLIMETVDIDKGTTLREEGNPTGDFVGLTREQIVEYLDSYMENIPLVEYEKGLSSYELVSFSSKEFCIRKTYDTSINPNKFYVTLKNNYVIIYYSDKTSVYDYTSINGNSLPYSDKLELLRGFYVKDSDELYALLEGYTS